MDFIKFTDNWQRDIVLNVNHIIAVMPCLDNTDKDFEGVRTRIQYGSGYMDEIYLSESVDEVFDLISR